MFRVIKALCSQCLNCLYNMNVLLILSFIILIKYCQIASASLGDSFPSYKSCADTCKLEECEEGTVFSNKYTHCDKLGLLFNQ